MQGWNDPASTPLPFKLVGGRDAARAAGISGKNHRGRQGQWYDMDGDGTLDAVFFNEERYDEMDKVGEIFMNRGGRQFQRYTYANGKVGQPNLSSSSESTYHPLP